MAERAETGTKARPERTEASTGFFYGVAAYSLWGLFPLYWPLLKPAGAFELLGHRIVWSLLVMLALVVLLRRGPAFRALVTDRRRALLLASAAMVLSANWATYIWSVNNGRVVEASLGYFINPLVTVLMGVFVIGERLRRLQWMAVVVGALAVVILTIDYGRLPWVALILAFSFGTYGLLKKTVGAGPIESLAFETAVVAPVALGYLAVLASRGDGHFIGYGMGHALLLMTTGLVTAVPLICFGAAANRIPMVTLGLLQYLAPVFQFLLGVFWLGEDMPLGRWVGFTLVWLALAIFTTEALRHRRGQLRLAAEASAV